MKKLITWFTSAVLVLVTAFSFVACGMEDIDQGLKVTVNVEESITTVCGKEFEVPVPQVEGVTNYDTDVAITDKDGNAVNYNEERNNFYAKKLGVDAYTITYTISYKDGEDVKSVTATTKITTTDGEKPTIKAPEYITGIRGDKIVIPEAEVIDNSGEKITPTVAVKDDKGNKVDLVEENGVKHFIIGEVAQAYTIVYSAVDSTGNKATDFECKVLIRNSIKEVESFDVAELVNVVVTSAESSVVKGADAPEGAVGGVLKVHMPVAGESHDGYVSITIGNLGVTDFTNVSRLKMRVYSTVDLSNNPGKHSGNAIVAGATDGLFTGRNVTANTWTQLEWNRNDVKTMFNGELANKYQRPFMDDVQEIRLDIDNAGWWGDTANGEDAGEQWKSQDITLYIDDVEVEYINANWQPVSYEDADKTVYEINNFNDDARVDFVMTTAQDPSKVSASISEKHTLPFDPANPEKDNMSLRVEFSSHKNGYPRFLINMEKVAKKFDLAKLPDNAVIKTDFFVEECGPGKLAIDGGENFVFYNKGDSTEHKSAMNKIWVEAGQKETVTTTIKAVKEAGVDLGKIEYAGLFFYADEDWIDGPYTAVVYFDNFRIEVPKHNVTVSAQEEVTTQAGALFTIPQPVIKGTENYTLDIEVTNSASGEKVVLNENAFTPTEIGLRAYTITYTVKFDVEGNERTIQRTTFVTTEEKIEDKLVPVIYENEQAKVYEINNFNNSIRFDQVFTTSADESKIKATLSDQHTLPFDPANPEKGNKSLRIEFSSHSNGYPRFLVRMDKIAQAIGLANLPDNALIKLDMYLESCGPDKTYIDGGDNFVFYNAGDGTEHKSGSIGDIWLEVGQQKTFVTSIGNAKKVGVDFANLETMGFFFYADIQWTKNYTAVLYVDNFRVEIPKLNVTVDVNKIVETQVGSMFKIPQPVVNGIDVYDVAVEVTNSTSGEKVALTENSFEAVELGPKVYTIKYTVSYLDNGEKKTITAISEVTTTEAPKPADGIVENFENTEDVNVVVEQAEMEVVNNAPEGANGNALKVHIPVPGAGFSGYAAIIIKNLKVTDFTNVDTMRMRAYSTVALSHNHTAHNGNAIVAKGTYGAEDGKDVPANIWTEITFNRVLLEKMFDGKEGRPAINNVTEIRFDIDNAGWWGDPANGEYAGEQWKSQDIVLYIDDIVVVNNEETKPVEKLVPVVYETTTAKVYEINNFNDEMRFNEVFTTSADESKIKATLSDQHTLPFDPANPEKVNKSLKVEFTSHPGGYPRFLVKMDKIASAIGLKDLPDNAIIKLDIYVETCTHRQGALDGGDEFVFYNKGDSNEKKSKMEYMWLTPNSSKTLTTTIGDAKACGADLANLNTMGFYFNAAVEDAGDYTAVVYVDNFRVEVPKV